jgi:hypothetical protein
VNGTYGNLYHVAKLIEICLQNYNKETVHALMDSNVIFQLADHIYNPALYDLLESMLDLYNNK